MILVISRSLLDTIVADCARDPHRERCGLLLGSNAHVLAVRPAANVAPDPATEFEIAPGALIEAVRAAGDGGRYWLIVTDTHASAWHFTGEGAVEGFDAVALAITGDET
jgi:proteasome lid subunit RPN8/RPN11